MSLLFATAGTVDFAVGAYALLAAAVATSVAGPLGIALAHCSASPRQRRWRSSSLVLARTGTKDHIVVALASFGLSVAIASFVLLAIRNAGLCQGFVLQSGRSAAFGSARRV